ncbi:conserved hypothetical protein [Halobacteriovorax marinus SJ]|uniref:NGG1p interacting factor NIF3 n=1 Tax=Halobacteriovorax marinus (strain ATCC BAA-682 / DSM 15412 / SJ) TaxID=862908 RepID=E1X206_HALMS|nr:NIF3 1 [Halobacteriovorax marinus]CBW26666.1 conserved hypothetical protein [Halobacteriovorax marinus SJ]
MKKIIVFVPKSHIEQVKEALFKAGAGRIGNYDKCCFETVGMGQFRPLKGSQAFIGKVGELEKVEEVKLELVCENNLIQGALSEMIEAHPYEIPAYEVYSLDDC